MKFHLISLTIGISSFVTSVCTLGVRSEASFQPDFPIREIRPSQSDDTRTFFDAHSHSNVESEDTERNLPSDPSALRLFKRARNRNNWTTEESNLLLDLKAQGWSWKEIANALPGRTEASARQKYYLLKNKPLTTKRRQDLWTPEQDKLLQDLKAQGQPWEEITKSFPGRSQSAMEQRYRKIKKNLPKSDKERWWWTPEEDQRLLDLAKDNVSWKGIAKQLPGRSPVAILQHYKHLGGDKQAISNNYKAKEDELIIQAVEEGKTWEEISQALGKSVGTARVRAKKLEKLGRIDLSSKVKKYQEHTNAEFELIRKMRADGMLWREIIKRFPGQSESTLYNQYTRYKMRKEEGTKAEKEEIEEP